MEEVFKITSQSKLRIGGYGVRILEFCGCLYAAYVYGNLRKIGDEDLSRLVAMTSTYSQRQEAVSEAMDLISKLTAMEVS